MNKSRAHFLMNGAMEQSSSTYLPDEAEHLLGGPLQRNRPGRPPLHKRSSLIGQSKRADSCPSARLHTHSSPPKSNAFFMPPSLRHFPFYHPSFSICIPFSPSCLSAHDGCIPAPMGPTTQASKSMRQTGSTLTFGGKSGTTLRQMTWSTEILFL